jgi:hypothetical protein
MAGGIFPNQPLVFNIKCIIFSIICITLFLYKPSFKSNLTLFSTLFIIFVLAYVAMAWYDWAFDCSLLPLEKGKYSFTGMFKPRAHKPEKQEHGKKTKKDISLQNYLIHLSHILIFFPMLLYISIKKGNSNPFVFPLLGAVAVMTLFYHGAYLIFSTKKDTEKE